MDTIINQNVLFLKYFKHFIDKHIHLPDYENIFLKYIYKNVIHIDHRM